MGEVIPFKGIGVFLEEITQFAGSRRGSVTFSHKESKDEDVWFAVIAFETPNGDIRQQFTSDTFNTVVLEVSKFVKNVS